jgi:hypothetical protein
LIKENENIDPDILKPGDLVWIKNWWRPPDCEIENLGIVLRKFSAYEIVVRDFGRGSKDNLRIFHLKYSYGKVIRKV